MCVAPGSGIELADIEPTDKRDTLIDDKQLAMVARIAPWVKRVPHMRKRAILKDVDGGWETLEGPRHNKIGKTVKDNVDRHTLVRFARQVLLEGLPKRVALPDKGLQVDRFAGAVDRL